MKKKVRKIINVTLSILLGGAILYWMYRGLDIDTMEHVLLNEMNWWWMAASLPFGVLAQMFRGWRWKQTLEPLDEHPRTSTCIHAIFLSYAASLFIPRVGEFTRCGVLTSKEGTNFPKALGTVVTERAVDSLIMIFIATMVLLMQLPVFLTFFSKTGTRLDGIMDVLSQFSTTGYLVTAICAVAALVSIFILRKRLAFYNKVKATMQGITDGVMSLRNVRNVPLFIAYSIGIWAAYFLHYYLTFFCFQETTELSLACALVSFVVGSFAVLVPTPNGAGSWHFAVKTMLILYGVSDAAALIFVLIVHSLQTLLVALLGVMSWVWISILPAKK